MQGFFICWNLRPFHQMVTIPYSIIFYTIIKNTLCIFFNSKFVQSILAMIHCLDSCQFLQYLIPCLPSGKEGYKFLISLVPQAIYFYLTIYSPGFRTEQTGCLYMTMNLWIKLLKATTSSAIIKKKEKRKNNYWVSVDYLIIGHQK